MDVVRAIEIGFGTSSVITGVNNDGKPEVLTFKSVAATYDKKENDLAGGLIQRDTVTVYVDEECYEVGPDAHLLSDRSSGRVLNNGYIESRQFKALFAGCLHYINEDEIDLLVLGLPVNNYHRKKDLEQICTGTHQLSHNKTVCVKKVWVIAQPIGGLLYFADQLGQNGYESLKDENILCVDPGYSTLDWLYTHGLKVNSKRSDAVDKGMSAILEGVSQRLRKSFPNLGTISLDIIDKAFWGEHQGTIKISGRRYPFPICSGRDCDGNKVKTEFDLTSCIRDIVRSGITDIRNSAGDGADIDRMIIMGGPYEVYIKELQQAYPHHKIEIVQHPLKAICLGMYLGGLQYQQALKKKGAA